MARATHQSRAYLAAVAWLKAHPDTPCVWCGRPATTIDHEPAVALGGGDDDLVPACAPCNYKRGAQLKAALMKARKLGSRTRFDRTGALVASETIELHRDEADSAVARSWTPPRKTDRKSVV